MFKQFSIAALIGAAAFCPLRAANMVYTINTTIQSAVFSGNPLQSDTITGTLTTDGVIGTLASSDIISYNLTLADNLNAANNITLNTSNSTVVEDAGSALSASATGLSFDYSGSGEFLIQANSPGPYSGASYFCFSTGMFACAAGETIAPQYVYTDGVLLAQSGNQSLNQPPNSATPEPASLALSGLGFSGIALYLSRRRKVPQCA